MGIEWMGYYGFHIAFLTCTNKQTHSFTELLERTLKKIVIFLTVVLNSKNILN